MRASSYRTRNGMPMKSAAPRLSRRTVSSSGGIAVMMSTGMSRHGSLPAHLERVVARLTVLRGGADRHLDTVLEAIVRELDVARAAAKRLRGPAREAFVQRLAELDRALIDAARAQCEAATLQRLAAEADAELAPFRSRMAGDAYERSRTVCIERALRDLLRLPAVAYE